MPKARTDNDIRLLLSDLDESEENVTKWEAQFLESVLYSFTGPLSPAQRAAAEKIIEKYNLDD